MAQPVRTDPQSYYDALTTIYKRLFGYDWHLGYWLNATNLPEAATRMNELMLSRLKVRAGMTVLDLGCGAGGPACFLAESTGCAVIGVSNSRSGIAEAERYARERGVQSLVRFEFGDALHLPLDQRSVDAVWSSEAIHNVEEKDALAQELARVLNPGGSLVVGDLFLLKDPGTLTTNLNQLKSFSFHLTTADDWIASLQRHGIRVQESISIGHHVGVQTLDICRQMCVDEAGRTEAGTLERIILERTVEATSLLLEAFKQMDISWGIWTGLKGT